jgi:hypothetical protein
VSWSGPTYRIRVWRFVLPAVISLLGVPRASFAGCQVPGGLSSHYRLSWEQDPLSVSGARPATLAPLVLTKPRCPSEVPHVVDSLTASVGLAVLDRAQVAPAVVSQRLALPALGRHHPPILLRLDRPPRPNSWS